MLPACPAARLQILQVKNGETSYLEVWSVCVYRLSGGGVLVLNHDRLGSSSRQDNNIIGQVGKCDQQAIEIHNRIVSGWVEPRSGYRVREGR